MRVSVVGASGNLGRHLCEELTALGHQVDPISHAECDLAEPHREALRFGEQAWRYPELLARAESFYDSSRVGLRDLPWRSALAVADLGGDQRVPAPHGLDERDCTTVCQRPPRCAAHPEEPHAQPGLDRIGTMTRLFTNVGLYASCGIRGSA